MAHFDEGAYRADGVAEEELGGLGPEGEAEPVEGEGYVCRGDGVGCERVGDGAEALGERGVSGD